MIQPTNPPNSNYPPFDIVEITVTPGRLPTALTIDVQTVDGFIFPLTLTLNNQLGQVGNTLPTNGQGAVVNRQDIFTAYTTFMNDPAPGGAGAMYLPLVFGAGSIAGQAGGIVNPGLYIASGMNRGSPLNTVWNNTLNTLFTDPAVKLIQGVAAGATPADVYVSEPTQVNGLNALKLTGATTNQTYFVFDPMTPDASASESPGEMVFANNGVFADTSGLAVNSGET